MADALAGAQPLIDAVWHADLAAARQLLAGSPGLVNAHVYRKNTLLFFAVRVPGYDGHGDAPSPDDAREPARVEVIDLLVSHGADIEVKDKEENTPLQTARSKRRCESAVAECLERHLAARRNL